jgi:lipopolysaccharide biosynthesis glycosyltransferase
VSTIGSTSSRARTDPAAAAPARTLHLACATDGRYLPHIATMLHSALTAAGAPSMHAHVLHDPDVARGGLHALAEMVDRLGATITLHPVDPSEVAGLPEWDRIPTTMWHRVLLPALLPEVERVVYLDADTVVLAPLTPLLDLDLTGHHLAAVTNVPERHMLGHAAELGLSGPARYFNSGVLVMNLALMRRDRSAVELVAYAREHAAALLWPDQDALNVVLGPTRLELHPRWNAMNSVLSFPWAAELLGAEAVAQARAEPAIVHFEGPGPCKPWHLLCNHPWRQRYAEHRRETPWPRWRREGVSPIGLARLARQHFTASRAV